MTKPADRLLYAEPRPDGRTPYWSMRTIWAAAEGKPTVTVAIEELNILDAVVWFGGPKNVEPTVRRVAERARDIFSADLSYPIIMTKRAMCSTAPIASRRLICKASGRLRRS